MEIVTAGLATTHVTAPIRRPSFAPLRLFVDTVFAAMFPEHRTLGHRKQVALHGKKGVRRCLQLFSLDATRDLRTKF